MCPHGFHKSCFEEFKKNSNKTPCGCRRQFSGWTTNIMTDGVVIPFLLESENLPRHGSNSALTIPKEISEGEALIPLEVALVFLKAQRTQQIAPESSSLITGSLPTNYQDDLEQN